MLSLRLTSIYRGGILKYSGHWGFSPIKKLRKYRIDFRFETGFAAGNGPRPGRALKLLCAALLFTVSFTGCATQQSSSKILPARADLNAARKHHFDAKTSAGYYLEAADEASRIMNG